MRQNAAIVATFDTRQDAEVGILQLAMSGFDRHALSIVATGGHSERRIAGFYSAGDRVRFWSKLGLSWGGFWGLAIGGVMFAVPAVDGFEIFGFLGAALVAAIEGALIIGGLGALGATLYSFGRPAGSVLKYETMVKAGTFLIVVKGSAEDAALAKRLLLIASPALPPMRPIAVGELTRFLPVRA